MTGRHLFHRQQYFLMSVLVLLVSGFSAICSVDADAAPGLYETNRHIGRTQYSFWPLPWLLGPYYDPITACKAEVYLPDYPNNNFAKIVDLGGGNYSCYCHSNSSIAPCGTVNPLCPLGYKGGGCHIDAGFPNQLCNTNSPCKPAGEIPLKNTGLPSCEASASNPINAGVGNKYQKEVDSVGSASGPGFARHYNSSKLIKHGSLGLQWRHTYDRAVSSVVPLIQSGVITVAEGVNTIPLTVTVNRPDGKAYYFFNEYNFLTNDVVSAWSADADILDRFESLYDTSTASISGFRYTTSNNIVEIYDVDGILQSVTDILGNTRTLSYDQATGLLDRVSSNTGGYLQFRYDSNSRISSITDHAGRVWTYHYDAFNNLEYVNNPDATTKQYHYEDIGFPNALTGITDERGIRYATYAYDASG
ncbi:MAG TPA: hypothetical protein ENJ35_04650, partial [Gammaproteobacteria bacterium]|nr:hypothetical protein [Gammaproteobacteria bacterium]